MMGALYFPIRQYMFIAKGHSYFAFSLSPVPDCHSIHSGSLLLNISWPNQIRGPCQRPNHVVLKQLTHFNPTYPVGFQDVLVFVNLVFLLLLWGPALFCLYCIFVFASFCFSHQLSQMFLVTHPDRFI